MSLANRFVWRAPAVFARCFCRVRLLGLGLGLAACGSVPTSAGLNTPTADSAPASTAFVPPTTAATPSAAPVIITTSSRRPLPGELFDIQAGATMFVDVLARVDGGTTTPLQLRFDALLKDERCPRLVACVVRGDAEIAIVAQLGQTHGPQTVHLHTDLSLAQDHAVYEGYEISLAELKPTGDHPGDTLAFSSYRATLLVTSAVPALPTTLPEPSAVPTPRNTLDACVLAHSAMIATHFGAIQGAPTASAIAAHSGQQCIVRAEHATITLRFYLGDTATAQAIIAAAQQAGTHFSEVTNVAASMSAFGEDQQRAALLQQSNDAIFVIEVVFSGNQPNDHEHVRQSLAAIQTMALVRYLGVKSGQITLPTAHVP